MKKEIGYIGLGKMGENMALRLREKAWRVVAFDRDLNAVEKLKANGVEGTGSIKELVNALSSPKLVWVMVPAGKPVQEVIFAQGGLTTFLRKGDIIIDGGNSFPGDSIKTAKKLSQEGISFLDVGVSGGPSGARNGACLMIGGEKTTFDKLVYLFEDLAVPGGVGYMGTSGAGHFAKMVHNGIEYGMMQAIAEGFTVMKKSPFKLNLREIARVYNHGSVVESRLMGWLESAFQKYGEDLMEVSGSPGHTGEGEWTVQTAKTLRLPVPVIKGAFDFRVQSAKKPSYAGKILSALRNQFGGHAV